MIVVSLELSAPRDAHDPLTVARDLALTLTESTALDGMTVHRLTVEEDDTP